MLLAPAQRLKPASAQFLLGTDAYGRDVLSRILYGGRISLLIGLVSGFFKWVDAVLMRIMLRALVRNNPSKAAIGVIYDPASAKAAHEAGEGATLTLALGGKSGIPGDAPYEESFVVEKLSDGKFVAPGPYYGGRDMDMGLSACLRIGDVRVVVSSHKAQLADQAMYRYVGIEPTTQSILVNKSSVHFRADFEPIAETLLICAAPGAMPADTATLPCSWRWISASRRRMPSSASCSPSAASCRKRHQAGSCRA